MGKYKKAQWEDMGRANNKQEKVLLFREVGGKFALPADSSIQYCCALPVYDKYDQALYCISSGKRDSVTS